MQEKTNIMSCDPKEKKTNENLQTEKHERNRITFINHARKKTT